jgi:hypothetical protein
MKKIKISLNSTLIALLGMLLFSVDVFPELPPGYTAKPFRDSIQQIPGRFFVWRYDQADARGISWETPRRVAMTGDYYQYDGRSTAGVEDYIINRILNPAWDVYGPLGKSYPANPADTIANPAADTTLIYNDMNATKDGIYIGYIEHGEWLKSTVNVAEDGYYQIDLMVTSNSNDPSISISALNGTDSISTGKMKFKNTGFYHNYVFQQNIGVIQLKKGLQIIRTDVTGQEPFNLWFYKFTKVEKPTSSIDLQKPWSDVRTSSLNDGSIQLTFSSNSGEPVTVNMYDSVGRTFGSEILTSLHAGTNVVTLSNRPKEGLVFVRLTRGGDSFVSKILIPARN